MDVLCANEQMDECMYGIEIMGHCWNGYRVTWERSIA